MKYKYEKLEGITFENLVAMLVRETNVFAGSDDIYLRLCLKEEGHKLIVTNDSLFGNYGPEVLNNIYIRKEINWLDNMPTNKYFLFVEKSTGNVEMCSRFSDVFFHVPEKSSLIDSEKMCELFRPATIEDIKPMILNQVD